MKAVISSKVLNRTIQAFLFVNKDFLERKIKIKKENVLQLLIRALCIALAVVMCIILGACGSKDTSSEIALGEEDGEYEALDGMDDEGSGTNADGMISGSNSGTTSKSTGTSKTTANTDWINDIPKKLQGTTVNFAVLGDENATEYAKVVKLFTKKTKINVKWVTYNEDLTKEKCIWVR